MLFFYCSICKVVEEVSRYTYTITHFHNTEEENKPYTLEQVTLKEAEALVHRHTFKL